MCAYKDAAKKMFPSTWDESTGKMVKFNKVINEDKIAEKKKEVDEACNLFAKKFGILKKASVLLFYGRANNAFEEIAKACQIIKNQKESEKEKDQAL